jgi:hypothetical protein
VFGGSGDRIKMSLEIVLGCLKDEYCYTSLFHEHIFPLG